MLLTKDQKAAATAPIREMLTKGSVLPQQVFEAAKPATSPLHGCGFEWNQKEAWTKYNVDVAQKLIAAVGKPAAAEKKQAVASGASIQVAKKQSDGSFAFQTVAPPPTKSDSDIVIAALNDAGEMLHDVQSFADKLGVGDDLSAIRKSCEDLSRQIATSHPATVSVTAPSVTVTAAAAR